MPRVRPGGTRSRNASLPDTGEVVVKIDPNFDPLADKPSVLVYGSSTPQAKAFQAAEDARNNGFAPTIQATSPGARIVQGSGDMPEDRNPAVAYVDEFEADDGPSALRKTEDRARKRDRERAERAEKAAADALNWGNQQAQMAATAVHAVTESQLDTVANALRAAEGEAEAAETAMIEAKTRGDIAGEVRAQRALAKAEQRIATLQAGKDELEVQVRQKPQPAAPPAALNANVEAILSRLPNLIPAERDWIRKHPETLLDPNNQQAMTVAFRDANKRGIERGSPEYFEFFEERLGIEPDGDDGGDEYEQEEPVRQTRRQEPPARRRVAAPVSHTSSAPGRAEQARPGSVRLTEQMREFARISGVDEATYARGVMRLAREKEAGMYGNQPTK